MDMTKQNQVFDVAAQLKELNALQPISVTFKGRPREVHFFHRGTGEAFSDELRGISENDSMKRRKQREVRLLAIVLADLHGCSPFFRRFKRWLWRKRLARSRYSDLEAVALLEAARERIQDGKQLAALCAIILAQMQALIASMRASREQLAVLVNESEEKEEQA